MKADDAIREKFGELMKIVHLPVFVSYKMKKRDDGVYCESTSKIVSNMRVNDLLNMSTDGLKTLYIFPDNDRLVWNVKEEPDEHSYVRVSIDQANVRYKLNKKTIG